MAALLTGRGGVIGPRATPPTSKQTVISQSLLRQFNRDTWATVWTPRLSVSRNSRNEHRRF